MTNITSLAFDIEIENEELSLFSAVATSDSTNQTRLVGANSPDDTTAATALQRHQITNEFAC